MFWKIKFQLGRLNPNLMVGKCWPWMGKVSDCQVFHETSVCNASDSIRACSTYILLQDRNLPHIRTHTRGPFRPLTSAKWQLHQGGDGSSKKTIHFLWMSVHVSDEAFIIYPNKIFSFFLIFLFKISLQQWLTGDGSGCSVGGGPPSTDTISLTIQRG